jgi:L-2,4-diaminobutyrate decarboxylase
MERDAALPFVDLASRYFLRTRDGTDPVSTALSSAEIAPRFDEPLPQNGRPLNEVAARIEHDVMTAMNQLAHPMCMGHQVSAPLPVAVLPAVATTAMTGVPSEASALRRMASASMSMRQSRDGMAIARSSPRPNCATARVTA